MFCLDRSFSLTGKDKQSLNHKHSGVEISLLGNGVSTKDLNSQLRLVLLVLKIKKIAKKPQGFC